MRLSLGLLFCSYVAAAEKKKTDPNLWFFGQSYKSTKLMMLSTAPYQVIGKRLTLLNNEKFNVN